jgi:uncharacterized protein
MHFKQESGSGHYHIKGYKPGLITVNEINYSQSIVVTPMHLLDNWPPQTLKDLTEAHFTVIFELQPEVILLGTGKRLILPPFDLINSLKQYGIGIEIMDTPAACRTYNILMSENRQVVAAMLIH